MLPRGVPIWHCSRWGLPCRSCCQSRGGLLPHRFTFTPTCRVVSFLWRFPSGFPGRALPGTVLVGVRTFLERRKGARGHPAIRARGELPRPSGGVNGMRGLAARSRAEGRGVPATGKAVAIGVDAAPVTLGAATGQKIALRLVGRTIGGAVALETAFAGPHETRVPGLTLLVRGVQRIFDDIGAGVAGVRRQRGRLHNLIGGALLRDQGGIFLDANARGQRLEIFLRRNPGRGDARIRGRGLHPSGAVRISGGAGNRAAACRPKGGRADGNGGAKARVAAGVAAVILR
ncbi:hypothetical protein KVU_1965 [Ketogulonicigenium vulgare WSH-001]|uniref:Uncharacterized protein n=1 Tax=Ketogulonicigenium vulgare (strain WSH-001) TaxID=759362 RepID=F9Y4S0_KETVW|nr:hypothetical protein KVU_1965 [Ketogulonicigenium vulgare WSH-001]